MKIIDLAQIGQENVGIPFERGAYSASVPSGYDKVMLFADTIGGFADIYIEGRCIHTLSGAYPATVDISGSGGKRIKIVLEDDGSVCRGAKLFLATGNQYVAPNGLYAYVTERQELGARIEAVAELVNDGEKTPAVLEFTLYNKNGHRIVSRKKKLTLLPGNRTVIVPMNIRRVNEYTAASPYIYSIGVKIYIGDTVADEFAAPFAIRGNEPKFSGAYINPLGGIIGGMSTLETETARLAALESVGVDAVRIKGCPSEAMLSAMDKRGVRCIVDLFDNWTQPVQGSLGHIIFKYEKSNIIESCIRLLRSHPCVIMYSVISEKVRYESSDLAEDIISEIKVLDSSRPVIGKVGGSADDTENEAEIAEMLDAVCLSSVKAAGYGKPVVFVGEAADEMYEDYSLFDEADVLGEVSGSQEGEGVLDGLCLPTTAGIYRGILRRKSPSFIATGTDTVHPALSWSGIEGEPVKVFVYTPADVVALYLNGKLIDRQLAGRVNKYIATFDTVYRKGVLDAVCYEKGAETDKCNISSRAAAKIKLTAPKRAAVGSLVLVRASLADVKGVPVNGDTRDISVSVDGGKLIKLQSANGLSEDNRATVSGGAAMLIRVGASEKVTVTVTGEHLRAGKISFPIK